MVEEPCVAILPLFESRRIVLERAAVWPGHGWKVSQAQPFQPYNVLQSIMAQICDSLSLLCRKLYRAYPVVIERLPIKFKTKLAPKIL
jgi:hypothetical protein